MSTVLERRDSDRYAEYQRQQRGRRVETLGGAVTMLLLATIDLGLSGVADPASEASGRAEPARGPEAASARVKRQRRLAEFTMDTAELGYARVA